MRRRAGSWVGSTPEAAWASARPWEGLPSAELPRGQRVCVASAHPDDDVLAVGGLLQRLAAANTVTVVIATDGEASHPGSRTTTPEEIARVRREETDRALEALGVAPAAVHRLGLPDSGLAARGEELAATLGDVLADEDLVLSPWTRDGHPDHEAVAAACAGAARWWQFPVWAWSWARPDGDDLPWAGARRHDLTDDELRRKRAAIGCFTSQTTPLSDRPGDEVVLDAALLAHFDRGVEVVLT